jgi:hypothetical protein
MYSNSPVSKTDRVVERPGLKFRRLNAALTAVALSWLPKAMSAPLSNIGDASAHPKHLRRDRQRLLREGEARERRAGDRLARREPLQHVADRELLARHDGLRRAAAQRADGVVDERRLAGAGHARDGRGRRGGDREPERDCGRTDGSRPGVGGRFGVARR